MHAGRLSRRVDLATPEEHCTNCAMIDEDALSAPILYLRDAAGRTAGEQAGLSRNDEGHVKALRLAPGDAVRVTDARGALWAARLAEDGGVRLIERLAAPPPLEVELWAPVGAKQATLWLVEKAAEFGLRRLRPVECRRSASVADAGRSRGFWQKAERRALAAVKQSGSAWAPEIDRPAGLEDRLADLSSRGDRASSGPRIVLDREGTPLERELESWDGRSAAVILLGPEGGLTDDERSACAGAGLRPAALGPTILRFETAAVAALAVAAQRALELNEHTPTEGADR
jgi:16S rRNA (uracil1498-N3)-methyltransferase